MVSARPSSFALKAPGCGTRGRRSASRRTRAIAARAATRAAPIRRAPSATRSSGDLVKATTAIRSCRILAEVALLANPRDWPESGEHWHAPTRPARARAFWLRDSLPARPRARRPGAGRLLPGPAPAPARRGRAPALRRTVYCHGERGLGDGRRRVVRSTRNFADPRGGGRSGRAHSTLIPPAAPRGQRADDARAADLDAATLDTLVRTSARSGRAPAAQSRSE